MKSAINEAIINLLSHTMNVNTLKKTQGRRKIAIQPINNQNNRQVTFSKRRLGLFKKASELCILTGAEIAIIVQSLKGKRIFAFGHPSVDAVIDRYVNGKSLSTEVDKFDNVQQNSQYYSQICRELEAEKQKKQIIEELMILNDNNDGGFWWDEEPTNDMGIEELEEFVSALEELKKNVTRRADELSMINGSSMPTSSLNSSSINIARFGIVDQYLNEAVDYCASIVPFDFDHQGDDDLSDRPKSSEIGDYLNDCS